MNPVPPVTKALTGRHSSRRREPTLGQVERSRNGRAAESRYGEGVRNPRARQRALCIAAGPQDVDLSELRELLRTAGVAVAGELTQRRSQPDPDRYFGKGKLGDLKRTIEEQDANLVACDDELLPRQERNLEEALGVPVIDRTAIILDIFADHAGSAEGKLQVELAQLEYNLARMRGLWTHLERRRELTFRHPGAVLVSAATGEGLDDLGRAIESQFLRTLRPMELLVPYGE